MAPTDPQAPRPAAPQHSRCPIARVLDIFGDQWSLLIVRDALFRGSRRFDDFMAGGERISSDTLSRRLAHLVEAGILSANRDPFDRRGKTYRLTATGKRLAPLMVELLWFGAVELGGEVPPDTLERLHHDRLGLVLQLRRQWRYPRPGEELLTPRARNRTLP